MSGTVRVGIDPQTHHVGLDAGPVQLFFTPDQARDLAETLTNIAGRAEFLANRQDRGMVVVGGGYPVEVPNHA